jgi:hypothetical protein
VSKFLALLAFLAVAWGGVALIAWAICNAIG